MHILQFESLTVFSIWFIFICYSCSYAFKLSSHSALHHSTVLYNVEVVEHCVTAAGKNKYDATVLSFKSDK